MLPRVQLLIQIILNKKKIEDYNYEEKYAHCDKEFQLLFTKEQI